MFKRGLLTTAAALCLATASKPGPAQRSDSGLAKLPAWDVISVKQSEAQKCQGMGMGKTPDGIDMSCVPLLSLIQQAYGILETNRIVGAPEWARGSARYDIHAKVPGVDAAAFSGLGQEDTKRMLQSLLADRFHMKVHLEKRDMPVYDLMIAKGGPKLKAATVEESAKETRLTGGRGKIEAVGAQPSTLRFILGNEVGRPVVDKSGLAGKYDFALEYVPASPGPAEDAGGVSIFTALQEQLGLKLEPSKEPTDVLVIDSINRPAAN